MINASSSGVDKGPEVEKLGAVVGRSAARLVTAAVGGDRVGREQSEAVRSGGGAGLVEVIGGGGGASFPATVVEEGDGEGGNENGGEEGSRDGKGKTVAAVRVGGGGLGEEEGGDVGREGSEGGGGRRRRWGVVGREEGP